MTADTLTERTRLRSRLRWWTYRTRQRAWMKAAHLVPPRLKYLAAIDLVAGVSTREFADVAVPDIRAMDAIGAYEKRHRISR